MTTLVDLNCTFHGPKQEGIFHATARNVIAACGRRFGKTDGAFRRLIELAVDNPGSKILWVDHDQGNIKKYIVGYFMPIVPPELYKWDKQGNVISFWNGTVVHFGSSQAPQGLEGFGYDYVFLNEAGIILKGPKGESLWYNTIAPMTMEGRKGKGSQNFIFGTPKGLGLFRDFYKKGQDPDEKEWVSFSYSTYDNKHLTEAMIDEVMSEVPKNARRQEVYAEFLDQDDRNMVLDYDVALEALNRDVPDDKGYWPIWGLDVARGGADDTALAKRRGLRLMEPVEAINSLTDGNQVADWVRNKYVRTPDQDKPKEILVDEIGLGASPLDIMRRMRLPVRGVNVSKHLLRNDIYFRGRDELWFRGRDFCEKGSLGGDRELMKELTLLGYKYNDSGVIKVDSKDELKKLGHPSPNKADAFLLTFACGVERKRNPTQNIRRRYANTETTWMSM